MSRQLFLKSYSLKYLLLYATLICFELETPRDRNGTFEPQIVKKHQTTISKGL